MQIYTEFIVLYADRAMPSEEKFCPSFWQAENSRHEGDYYYDNIDGRWTTLELTKVYDGGQESTLEMDILRTKRLYEPASLEAADLGRFFDYRREGRYDRHGAIKVAEVLATASLAVLASNSEDYREYLHTVGFFLDYTSGILVNHMEHDGASFRKCFLDPG